MTLAFFEFGFVEILLLLIAILFTIWVGKLGKETDLGYWGTIILAIFTTPFVALVVVLFLRYKKSSRQI
jgi:hypothetical protein